MKLLIIMLFLIILNVSSESTDDLDPIIEYLLNGRVTDVDLEGATGE